MARFGPVKTWDGMPKRVTRSYCGLRVEYVGTADELIKSRIATADLLKSQLRSGRPRVDQDGDRVFLERRGDRILIALCKPVSRALTLPGVDEWLRNEDSQDGDLCAEPTKGKSKPCPHAIDDAKLFPDWNTLAFVRDDSLFRIEMMTEFCIDAFRAVKSSVVTERTHSEFRARYVRMLADFDRSSTEFVDRLIPGDMKLSTMTATLLIQVLPNELRKHDHMKGYIAAVADCVDSAGDKASDLAARNRLLRFLDLRPSQTWTTSKMLRYGIRLMNRMLKELVPSDPVAA